MQEFQATDKDIGLRADVFIANKYPEFSRSSLEELFDDGSVSVGAKPVKQSLRIKGSERFKVDETKLRYTPKGVDLPIIYEDKDVTIIDKPEGILSHSKGALNKEATVASFISSKLSNKLPGGNRAGIVHRLDRATSGVIATVKTSNALSLISKQFSTRRVKKTYLAVVEGVPEPAKAIIDAPIERNPNKPQSFRVGAQGKSAATTYSVIKVVNKGSKQYSLLELKPATGRTHQLRVHLSYIGHPIVGDSIYGSAAEHMYLHASSLELTLPSSERKIFTAEPPEYFKGFINEK